MSTIIQLAGALIIIAGIWLLSAEAALIIGGIMIVAVGAANEGDRKP